MGTRPRPGCHVLIRRARDDSGVRIAALDGTYNMAHPDAAIRAKGHRGLARTIELAEQLDVPFVTLCTGTRDPDSMWRHHPDNGLDDAWIDMTGCGYQRAVRGPPARRNPAGGARTGEHRELGVRAWTLLDQMADAHLKIVLDPANIVLSDRSRPPLDVLTESFECSGRTSCLLTQRISATTMSSVAAGTGIVPWADYWETAGLDRLRRGRDLSHAHRGRCRPRAGHLTRGDPDRAAWGRRGLPATFRSSLVERLHGWTECSPNPSMVTSVTPGRPTSARAEISPVTRGSTPSRPPITNTWLGRPVAPAR